MPLAFKSGEHFRLPLECERLEAAGSLGCVGRQRFVRVGLAPRSGSPGEPLRADVTQSRHVGLNLLALGGAPYLAPAQVPRFDAYLSFSGGPTLQLLTRGFGARFARPLYCSVDADSYFPEPRAKRWDLGYLGTYSADRQLALEELMLGPARASAARRDRADGQASRVS